MCVLRVRSRVRFSLTNKIFIYGIFWKKKPRRLLASLASWPALAAKLAARQFFSTSQCEGFVYFVELRSFCVLCRVFVWVCSGFRFGVSVFLLCLVVYTVMAMYVSLSFLFFVFYFKSALIFILRFYHVFLYRRSIMVFCVNCGTMAESPSAKFCFKCGSRLV